MLPTNATSAGYSGSSEVATSNVVTQGDPVQKTIPASDFNDSVSLQHYDWIRQQRFIGQGVPATVGSDIWVGGGVYPWLSTADNLLIAPGGDPADDVGGTGAQEIEIVGLNANWEPITERLATAGAAASAQTAQQFIRVNFVRVTRVGTFHGTEAAPILIVTAGGPIVQSIVIFGESRQSIFTVPKGFTAVFDNFSGGCAAQGISAPALTVGNRALVMALWAAPGANGPGSWGGTMAFTSFLFANKVQSDFVEEDPWSFPEMTDVWASVSANELQAGPGDAYLLWSIRLYRNN